VVHPRLSSGSITQVNRESAVSSQDELRDLLDRQTQLASKAAIESGGQLDAEQIKMLERLARLVEIRDHAKQPPARKRWPVAAALGGTLVIVSILLFAHVDETEVELDLTLSEISFTLPTQQVLSTGIEVDSLGISGLREMQLPRVNGQPAQTITATEDLGLAIRLSPALDEGREGSVSLGALALPAGSRVWLRLAEESSHQYQLSLEGEGLAMSANVIGPVQVSLSGAAIESPSQLDFRTPKAIFLQSIDGVLGLVFSPNERSKDTFSPQLHVSNLSFFRVDEFATTERTIVRTVSTILAGDLYLEALNGRAISLRSGERIRFEESEGEIRTLQLHDDHVALQFRGRVRGMSAGSQENQRSLMPTYLEWLQAQHGLSLLWGTTLYLFGLIVGVLRWWRLPI
jgi:hypothetical protein